MPRKCRSVATIALAAAAAMLTAAAQETFEVALWADDDSVAALPGVVSIDGHPCGGVAIVRLARMPPFDSDGPLGTELVVEADREGREIARWSVPVDYQPLAIRGVRLLVDHHGQRLWIGTDGSISREAGRVAYPTPTDIQCPAGGAHAQSDYAQCAAFADVADGRRRLLQFEATCT